MIVTRQQHSKKAARSRQERLKIEREDRYRKDLQEAGLLKTPPPQRDAQSIVIEPSVPEQDRQAILQKIRENIDKIPDKELLNYRRELHKWCDSPSEIREYSALIDRKLKKTEKLFKQAGRIKNDLKKASAPKERKKLTPIEANALVVNHETQAPTIIYHHNG